MIVPLARPARTLLRTQRPQARQGSDYCSHMPAPSGAARHVHTGKQVSKGVKRCQISVKKVKNSVSQERPLPDGERAFGQKVVNKQCFYCLKCVKTGHFLYITVSN